MANLIFSKILDALEKYVRCLSYRFLCPQPTASPEWDRDEPELRLVDSIVIPDHSLQHR